MGKKSKRKQTLRAFEKSTTSVNTANVISQGCSLEEQDGLQVESVLHQLNTLTSLQDQCKLLQRSRSAWRNSFCGIVSNTVSDIKRSKVPETILISSASDAIATVASRPAKLILNNLHSFRLIIRLYITPDMHPGLCICTNIFIQHAIDKTLTFLWTLTVISSPVS